ncbi:B-cell lymphoma/leukemia 10-like [Gigantopelta aegis]|uniref:B-cell lymphoma/leukemia 10-like n=1 Tax=Gigantopelta aegis TaxID=1735272 RepID=UPI001B88B44B|nr:B-cell lymphoma/leukemia 10-like [Gigantopelta aegis]
MSNEELILRGIKQEILRDKRFEIVKSLNPARHYDYLRSKYLLSGEDVEEIQKQETQQKRASLFLDKILQNGPNNCYDLLCESILVADKTRMHLLTMLNKEYENKLNNYKALIKTHQPRAQSLDIAVDSSALPRPPRPGLNVPYKPKNDVHTFPGSLMNIPPESQDQTMNISENQNVCNDLLPSPTPGVNISIDQEPYNDLSGSLKSRDVVTFSKSRKGSNGESAV